MTTLNPHPITSELSPDKLTDSLLPAATWFVAARPFTGPRALMRRFGIGLQRARWLLVDLEQQGVVRGHWSRLVAASHTRGIPVSSHRIYRVNPWVWKDIQAHSMTSLRVCEGNATAQTVRMATSQPVVVIGGRS